MVAARLSGGLTHVAEIQHAIGIASGLLLLGAWQRVPLPASLRSTPRPRGRGIYAINSAIRA